MEIKSINSKKAFTLIELLIVVGILAVVITGMMQIFTYMPRLSESASNSTKAMNEINSKLEEMYSTSFKNIISTYACECFDYIDNDMDGAIDYDHNPSHPSDMQCSQMLDNSESSDAAPASFDTSPCSFELEAFTTPAGEKRGWAVIYLSKSPYFDATKTDEENDNYKDGDGFINDDDVNNDLLDVTIVATWIDSYGRTIGEDINLNGYLDNGEDSDGDGRLSSTATITAKISRR